MFTGFLTEAATAPPALLAACAAAIDRARRRKHAVSRRLRMVEAVDGGRGEQLLGLDELADDPLVENGEAFASGEGPLGGEASLGYRSANPRQPTAI